MIPQYSIQEWHEQVPWNTDAMDLKWPSTHKRLINFYMTK